MFESLQSWLFHEDQQDFEQFKHQTRQPKLKLPKDFAQQLLDLELELEIEEQINEKMVNQLLSLYKLATEYYGQYDDKKYKIFTEKANKLLMKSNVQKAIEPIQNKEQKSNAQSTARKFNQDNSLMISIINKDLQKQEEIIQQRRQNRRDNHQKNDE